ncbi:MAG: recombinase RecA [Leptospiraceae bacterium]|nr:recombinase RecA [Leptospiraceae bacterium]MCZ8346384.1 recombinase RecA [Leptospiraceae bacterium]
MKKGKEDKNQEKEGTEKNQAIEAALSQIEKQFGKGSIMRLGSSESKIQASSIVSTGSLELDVALGIGGFPSGRIIEIYGPESSGKTTLTLSAVAEAQKKGGVAAFIDAEHALDPSYARKLGVNVEDLLVAQPDNGEEALEICESLVRSNAIDIIVIDSVAALVPRAEIEGDMGDSHMGLQARLMSQALRKLTGTIAKSNTTVIFINQIRMKIGVMFGSPETTTGGNALKFYASIRLDIRRIETLKEKEEPVGNRVRVKVVKNKMAPPFRQAEFDVMFSTGINRESTLIDMAVRHDLLAKAGSWYSYNGEKIGQGKEQVRNFFLENPDIAFKVENQIRDLNGLPILVATKAAPSEKKAKEKAIPSLEVEEAPEKEEIQREVAVGE